jgi:Uma2 family endonuclease
MRSVGTGHPATVDDLYRVEGKAEIVNGELVLMSAAGGAHGYAALAISASLFEYGKGTRGGYAMPDNVGFIVDLPNRRSFSPDAAFWTGGPPTATFFEGAPAFAAEVRSPEDFGPIAEQRLAQKRADYFAAGTIVVWDVVLDPEPTVRRYRADAPSQAAVSGPRDIADASLIFARQPDATTRVACDFSPNVRHSPPLSLSADCDGRRVEPGGGYGGSEQVCTPVLRLYGRTSRSSREVLQRSLQSCRRQNRAPVRLPAPTLSVEQSATCVVRRAGCNTHLRAEPPLTTRQVRASG